MPKFLTTVVLTLETNAPDEEAAIDFVTDQLYQSDFENFEITELEEVGADDLED